MYKFPCVSVQFEKDVMLLFFLLTLVSFALGEILSKLSRWRVSRDATAHFSRVARFARFVKLPFYAV